MIVKKNNTQTIHIFKTIRMWCVPEKVNIGYAKAIFLNVDK